MKRCSNTLILMVFCALSTIVGRAQQAPQYTQYMYNTQTINPGYTGSRGVMGITPFHRSQWAGVDGAPVTQSLTLGTPVGRKVGLGFSIINDRIGNGTNNTTDFGFDFSYGVRTSGEGTLSFGLKAGGRLITTDLNKLRYYQPGFNTSAVGATDQKFAPNIGVGAYYYTSNFYAGLSIPRVLTTDLFDIDSGNATYLAKDALRYYGIMGWVRYLGLGWKFKPAILVNTTTGEPVNVDLSANFMYEDTYIFGAAYRWNASVSLLTGFQLTDHLLVGIAYDRETTALGGVQFNDGSFEIFLRYELFFKQRRIVGARFF